MKAYRGRLFTKILTIITETSVGRDSKAWSPGVDICENRLSNSANCASAFSLFVETAR
jgi:hypothetical protein